METNEWKQSRQCHRIHPSIHMGVEFFWNRQQATAGRTWQRLLAQGKHVRSAVVSLDLTLNHAFYGRINRFPCYICCCWSKGRQLEWYHDQWGYPQTICSRRVQHTDPFHWSYLDLQNSDYLTQSLAVQKVLQTDASDYKLWLCQDPKSHAQCI